MTTRKSAFAAIVAASCMAIAVPAVAAPPSASRLPAARTLGEITYISGGVGQTEADAIKHVAKYYSLELEFLRRASPKDEFLSGVKVRIKDADGKMVLNVTSDGPLLLAKMPAGKYTVSAEHRGRIENREVRIAVEEHRRVVFEWQS